MSYRFCLVAAYAIVVCSCTANPPAAMDPISEAAVERLLAERLAEAGPALLALPPDVFEAAVPGPKAEDEIRFHAIPAGAGSCHLIECPGNTSPIIYDCGTTGETDNSFSRQQIFKYFETILDRYADDPIVILSHADTDHYSHIPEAMGVLNSGDTGRTAKRIWMGGERANYDGDTFLDWLQDQEDRNVPVEVGFLDLPSGFNNGGDAIAELQCGDAETFVMTVNTGLKTNARSMIVRVVYEDFVVTLTGDAFGITEDSASTFPGGAETTVLTGSHHGASTNHSNDTDWAQATLPQVTIFSAGGRHKHPKCSSMLRYKSSLDSVNPHRIRCGKTIGGYTNNFFVDEAEYVTEVSGVILVSSDGDTFSVECSAEPGCG